MSKNQVIEKNINKISIIGASGTGKTTLSDNLGQVLNLPVYHLDGINYFKNWEKRDKEERDKIIAQIIDKDRWVMDGTYNSTLKQRLKNSDLIIYLDYSSVSQVKGVIGRYIKKHGKERKEIPGCEERMSLEFLLWVVNWRKNKRANILNIISEINNEKVLIFKNRRNLNKWFRDNFNTKMVVR